MISWGVLRSIAVQGTADRLEEKNEILGILGVLGIFPVDVDTCVMVSIDCGGIMPEYAIPSNPQSFTRVTALLAKRDRDASVLAAAGKFVEYVQPPMLRRTFMLRFAFLRM